MAFLCLCMSILLQTTETKSFIWLFHKSWLSVVIYGVFYCFWVFNACFSEFRCWAVLYISLSLYCASYYAFHFSLFRVNPSTGTAVIWQLVNFLLGNGRWLYSSRGDLSDTCHLKGQLSKNHWCIYFKSFKYTVFEIVLLIIHSLLYSYDLQTY